MSKIKDGGAAFPVPNDANINEQEGMTLRDYFAAKAMQAYVTKNTNSSAENIAKWSYGYADAMLAERERVE